PLKYSTQSFVRDLFVFSTFTGISYADVKKLTWKDVITEDDGSLWISTERQKTCLFSPVLPESVTWIYTV
ncbi:MAG: hypothetical protein LBE91_16080, partial [Tannerella sp.]|nr:hypothetical protein [Tannerella sp.]